MSFLETLLNSDAIFFLLIGFITILHQVIEKFRGKSTKNERIPNSKEYFNLEDWLNKKLPSEEKEEKEENFQKNIKPKPLEKTSQKRIAKTIKTNSSASKKQTPLVSNFNSSKASRSSFFRKQGLKQAILYKEILGKPKAFSLPKQSLL